MPRKRTATEERIDGSFIPDESLIKHQKPAFKWMDTNRDGVITRDDIMALAKSWGIKLSKQEASDIIDAFDVDRDGKLSPKDYVALLGYEIDYYHSDELLDLFNLCDADGDGYLTKDDAKRLLKFLGEEYSSEKFSSLFKTGDGNEKRRRLSFDDFKALIYQ